MSLSRILRQNGQNGEQGKAVLEEQMRNDPTNRELRSEYLAFLRELTRRRFGLMYAVLPDMDFPLFFRANTSDILSIVQIFGHQEYGFHFDNAPRTILDLGAYCGFAAVYLSNRFNKANILCVEPSIHNFEMLRLNTAPYRNINIIHGAVWDKSTELNLHDRVGGHWGSRFDEESPSINNSSVKAYTLDELVKKTKRQSIDFIKCDIEGAEVEVFSDSHSKSLLLQASTVTVETHDRFRAGSTDVVTSAFPEDTFLHERSGEFLLFKKKDQTLRSKYINDESSEFLVKATGNLIKINLNNVNGAPWGIMAIDDETLQLHPNKPGTPAAQIDIPVSNVEGKLLRASCIVAGHGTNDVIFSIHVKRGANVSEILTSKIAPGVLHDISVRLPSDGPLLEISLRTEMASGASGNGGAWARWISPRIE